jgi:hypothetical protein
MTILLVGAATAGGERRGAGLPGALGVGEARARFFGTNVTFVNLYVHVNKAVMSRLDQKLRRP